MPTVSQQCVLHCWTKQCNVLICYREQSARRLADCFCAAVCVCVLCVYLRLGHDAQNTLFFLHEIHTRVRCIAMREGQVCLSMNSQPERCSSKTLRRTFAFFCCCCGIRTTATPHTAEEDIAKYKNQLSDLRKEAGVVPFLCPASFRRSATECLHHLMNFRRSDFFPLIAGRIFKRGDRHLFSHAFSARPGS